MKNFSLGRYFRNIFSYRELIFNLAAKDLKVRYKTAALGFLWALLNPLFMMVILSLVFTLIVKVKIENFPVFLLTALLPWYFFITSLTASTISIVDNANLVKKTSFPREIIPLSIVISNLINFLLSLTVLFIFMGAFKVNFSYFILFLPIVILLQSIFIFGLALISVTLHTFYRDVKYIVEFLLLAGFYLTPVFYPLSLVPEKFQKSYLIINPMADFISIYRDILFYGISPNPRMFGYVLMVSLLFFVVGLLIFRKNERIFADYV